MAFLFENDTNSIVKKIAKRRIEIGKLRRIMAGIIIFLSSCLLSFIGTYGYSLSYEYAGMTAYQVIYSNLTPADIEKLQKDKRIEAMGLYQVVGRVANNSEISLGIVCSDEVTMQLSNIAITDGVMPTQANEIAIERGYLKALKIDLELGSLIEIKYRNQSSRQIETQKFIITGFLSTTAQEDKNRVAYNSIVSREFVLQNQALADNPLSVIAAVKNAGTYSNQNLKVFVQKIGMENDIKLSNIQINNLNIDSNNISIETVFVIAAISAVIIAACSLVIYNIFYISVIGNVSFFGQLRTTADIGSNKTSNQADFI